MSKEKSKHRNRVDKIVKNTWNQVEFEVSILEFKPLELAASDDVVEDIHRQMLENEIHNLIVNHPEFRLFNDVCNEVNKNGDDVTKKSPVIRKSDVNKIFEYVSNRSNYQPVEIYFSLCEYFDYDHVKFFEFLSNIYKSKIIRGLGTKLSFNSQTKLF